jgi:CBS domain-containing protein
MGMVMLKPSEQGYGRKFRSNSQSVREAVIVDVTVFSPISTIQDAIYILNKTGCNYIVVFDGSEPVGMLSRLQLDRYTKERREEASTLLLRDVMLPIPFRARVYDRLVTVREAMMKRGLSWLPVLDERCKLAGIVLC